MIKNKINKDKIKNNILVIREDVLIIFFSIIYFINLNNIFNVDIEKYFFAKLTIFIIILNIINILFYKSLDNTKEEFVLKEIKNKFKKIKNTIIIFYVFFYLYIFNHIVLNNYEINNTHIYAVYLLNINLIIISLISSFNKIIRNRRNLFKRNTKIEYLIK